jgi:transcription termination/antitermination protein NusG
LVRSPEEAKETKEGEALPEMREVLIRPWRVAWTHSNCEQLVYDQLVTKGFDPFLPTAEVWSRRGRFRVRRRIPLFRGYLFLRQAVDKASYLEVCKARGLVRLLGQRWDQLEAVPDSEVDAIQKLIRSALPIFPYPFLRAGQRVRITGGPLASVEGILVRGNPKKGLVVVSIELLHRSVAVQLDCTLMEAA